MGCLQVDVYSFGVMLAEMSVLGGMLSLVQHLWERQGKDPNLKIPQIFRRMWEGKWHPFTENEGASLGSAPPSIRLLASRCCSFEPTSRPTFNEVLSELQGSAHDEIHGDMSFPRRYPGHAGEEAHTARARPVAPLHMGPSDARPRVDGHQNPLAAAAATGTQAGDPTDPTLPAGWFAHLDPLSGNTYYVSSTTGETTWTRPALSLIASRIGGAGLSKGPVYGQHREGKSETVVTEEFGM